MAVISNLAAYAAVISAVCPIDGVDGAGVIFFAVSATPAQIQAANAAAAAYIDVPPQIVSIQVILGNLTDQEYTALMQAATAQIATKPGLHRAMFSQRHIDLSKPAVQTLIQAIITAGILTAQRAQVVFVAPPIPIPPPVAS